MPMDYKNNLNINLLPREVSEKQKKSAGLSLLNRMSVGLLIVMAFFAAVTLSIRLLQKINLESTSQNLALAQSKVGSLGEREVEVALIKEYLSSYKSLSTSDEKKKAVFSLVAFLAPSDILFNDISISRDGNTVVSASSSSLTSIDKLLSDLTNKEKNSDLIARVDIDGLTLGKDSVYRFGLKIVTK